MIQAQGLAKRFGAFTAVDDVSFEAHPGEVLGLLGPNGAGKTTTMRMLTGFLPPSAGSVRLAGHDVVWEALAAHRALGYLPEQIPLYPEMTVRGYLGFQAVMHEIPSRARRGRVDDALERCRLSGFAGTMIGRLSKGYRQLVGLAQAILHDPPVLILDEPTIGIDPRQVVEVRALIRELSRQRTVVLSSHNLSEVSSLCQRVLILDRGKVIAMDTPAALATLLGATHGVELRLLAPRTGTAEALAKLPTVKNVTPIEAPDTETNRGLAEQGRDRAGVTDQALQAFLLETDDPDALRQSLVDLVVARGWKLREMTAADASLEEIFLRMTGRGEG